MHCRFARFRPRLFCSLLLALAPVVSAPSMADERAPIRDPDRTFRTYVWSYQELARRRVVMQQHDYSCGAAALATVIKYYWGHNVAEATFLDLMPKLKLTQEEWDDRIEKGLTLTDLRNLANEAGYDAVMGRVQFSELAEGKVPVIVGITVNDHDHFAVFRGTDGRFVYLADPLRGNTRTLVCTFIEQWQENAILVVAPKGTGPRDHNPLAVRADEMQRGVLNNQWIHRNALVPPIPNPIVIGP